MGWKGKVFAGEAKAAEFLSYEPYQEFIERELGFRPYPGTLNLRGSAPALGQLKKASEAFVKEAFIFEGRELGGLKLFPVTIGQITAGIVEPDRTRYGEEVAEVVASVCLREELGLEDGDTVDLELRDS